MSSRSPWGGAHRDPDTAAANIKLALLKNLDLIRDLDMDGLLALRYERVMGYGRYKE
jgi:acetyl-CoA carboxylase carboxyl transferase subunit alpha